MTLFAKLATLLALTAMALLPLPAWGGESDDASCLYPSAHERFGVTLAGMAERYDVGALSAGAYLHWMARAEATHPNGMHYFPMLRVNEFNASYLPYGYWPNGDQLAQIVRAHPGTTWLVGNEADYRWHDDHASPEAYARAYHDIYHTIKALDPSARIAANALATVSPLRMAWLERMWNAYQDFYGVEMPVDVWTVHTYVVNEMVYEWGADLPPGFLNAVGYSDSSWQERAFDLASGGTVHASQRIGSKAYFAFAGDQVTLHLGTGPDAGTVFIYIDNNPQRADAVDLYAPEPGIITRTYSNLPTSGDPYIGRRHHVRVEIAFLNNGASSGTWVRVDGVEAESTVSLPGGMLENNNPLQAQIIANVDDHDNLEMILSQIRTMRQWMADHGQRDKPLINTEYGILMGEELGFDYERVRTFMLDSFDLFMNDPALRDAEIGMPQDGNRLLQQWFWFILAMDNFNGARVHIGLFDPTSRELLPLGREFANYAEGLVSYYRDLEIPFLSLTSAWPLFAGEPALIELKSAVRNRGNLPSDSFRIDLASAGGEIAGWDIAGLSENYGDNYLQSLEHRWEAEITASQPLTLTLDGAGQIEDPCQANNQWRELLEVPPFTDLAISDMTLSPRYFDHRTTQVTITVDVSNLGGLGAAGEQIVVNLWDGDPDHDGVLLDSQLIERGQNLRQGRVRFDWRDFEPGLHELTAEVVLAAGEENAENNRRSVTVAAPGGQHFIFLPRLTAGR